MFLMLCWCEIIVLYTIIEWPLSLILKGGLYGRGQEKNLLLHLEDGDIAGPTGSVYW